mgnify:CR=1 FL=1
MTDSFSSFSNPSGCSCVAGTCTCNCVGGVSDCQVSIQPSTDYNTYNAGACVAETFDFEVFANGQWSTASTATPRADILTAQQASIVYLDSAAMSLKVFQNLVNTSEVKTALRYTNPIEMGGLEAQRRMVAQYLGLDNLFVSNAKKDTAKKGQSTVAADVWDDEYVLVFKRASQVSMREPALGRTFLWTPDSPGILTVDQYREEQSRSNIFRVRHNADEVVQFTGAGYLLSNITA